jgi:hypothetical protein
MRSSHHAALAVSLLALPTTACMPAYFRDVPPSFVDVDAPVPQITPSPSAATVVIYGRTNFGPPTNQAITYVLPNGAALAQVPLFAWASFEVPPGNQTIVAGVPEIGNVRPCQTVTGNFEAGKIYVLNRALGPAPSEDRPERWLSLMSRLRVDRAAGQARVHEQWEGFSAPCIERIEQARRAQGHGNTNPDPLGLARTELVIPPPP